MFNQNTRNINSQSPKGACHQNFSFSPNFCLGIGAMGSIQSHKSFSTSTNNLMMGNKSYGMVEGTPKFINTENGYPNNMKKTIGNETQIASPMESSIGINIVNITSMGAASTITMGGSSSIAGSQVNILTCIDAVRTRRLSLCRSRTVSECLSEDSYIVFEGCGDSGDDFLSDVDTESSGDETDYEDHLDEDRSGLCSNVDEEINVEPATNKPRHCVNNRKVHFANDKQLAEIHRMVTWSFAYRASRKGHWEEYARDRDRFQRRIVSCSLALENILRPDHRNRIFQERFAPLLITLRNDSKISTSDDTSSPAANVSLKLNASDHEINKSTRNKKKRNRRRRNGKKKKKNRYKSQR